MTSLQRLADLGWLNASPAINSLLAAPETDRIAEAIVAYQEWHGLTVTGEMDPRTVRSLHATRYCERDVMPAMLLGTAEARTPPRLPSDTIHIGFTNAWPIPTEDIYAAGRWATDEISRVCGASFVWVKDGPLPPAYQAAILASSGPIDGSGGTLAWSELANSQEGGPRATISQKYDSRENWKVSIALGKPPASGIDPSLVILHETLHAMGIPHINGETAVMNPAYNPALLQLQPADIRELVSRYGPAVQPEPPTPTPPSGVERYIIEGVGVKIRKVA